jgi:hypothetical protein
MILHVTLLAPRIFKWPPTFGKYMCRHVYHLSAPGRNVEKIQVSFKSDKNNGYFTLRPVYIYNYISLNSSQNEKCFRKKLQRNQNTFCVKCAVYDIRRKNMVEPDTPQITIQYGACALHAG